VSMSAQIQSWVGVESTAPGTSSSPEGLRISWRTSRRRLFPFGTLYRSI
jgi:hypothetical protein